MPAKTVSPATYLTGEALYGADNCKSLVDAQNRGNIDLHACGRGEYPGRAIPDGVLTGLNSIGCWDAKQVQDWGLDWHRNEGIEFTFLETGSMLMEIGSQELVMKPDDLVITRPWQQHKLGRPNIGIGRLHWLIIDLGVRYPNQEWVWPDWIILDRADLQELTKIIRQTEYIMLPTTKNVRALFAKLPETLAAERSTNLYSRLGIVVNDLLLTILEELSSQKIELREHLTSSRRSVEIFLAHLKENANQPWTLEDLARECGLGVTRFVHYCKQITNRSPMAYLNECRLDSAREILEQDPKATITEVAFDCGFSSSQYFSTQFKKRFKCTPRSLRAHSKRQIEVCATGEPRGDEEGGNKAPPAGETSPFHPSAIPSSTPTSKIAFPHHHAP